MSAIRVLVALALSSGDLSFYVYDKSAKHFSEPRFLGEVFGNQLTHYFVADWNQDSLSDLLVRTNQGDLLLSIYHPQSKMFDPPITIGTGFKFTHYFVSDWNGDGYPDVLVRTNKGELLLFQYSAVAKHLTKPLSVGVGFNFASYFAEMTRLE
jgi:hypothetical protein